MRSSFDVIDAQGHQIISLYTSGEAFGTGFSGDGFPGGGIVGSDVAFGLRLGRERLE